MDTSMRNDQVPVLIGLIRPYLDRSAPRGYRRPMFPSRWTEICGSLVRPEGQGHSDHDCSYLHVYISLSLRILLAHFCFQPTRLGRPSAKSYRHS